MFGYIRPCKPELLVREYEQYKAVYCQLCRTLDREYGFTAKFFLTYDCAFYAMLALSVSGAPLCEEHAKCVANPLKKCAYIAAKEGEDYSKAAALNVLLSYYKLEDDREDEGFFKSLAARLLLLLMRRSAKKAEGRYPFLADITREAIRSQNEAEKSRAGLDACAQPTADMLGRAFAELDESQRLQLSQFGYYLGRWVYLIDAADDLEDDMKEGKFNPFIKALGFEGLKALSADERRCAEREENRILNATVAMLLPAVNLLSMQSFGPIVENLAHKGLPEMQREIIFLHVKNRKKRELN